MTTETIAAAEAGYDRAALYAQWAEAARDTRWRYRDATVAAFYDASDRASAWEAGAAHVHVVDDIAAFLAERLQAADTGAAARRTYAAMLNDVHASRVETVALAEALARIEALEAAVAALRAEQGV